MNNNFKKMVDGVKINVQIMQEMFFVDNLPPNTFKLSPTILSILSYFVNVMRFWHLSFMKFRYYSSSSTNIIDANILNYKMERANSPKDRYWLEIIKLPFLKSLI